MNRYDYYTRSTSFDEQEWLTEELYYPEGEGHRSCTGGGASGVSAGRRRRMEEDDLRGTVWDNDYLYEEDEEEYIYGEDDLYEEDEDFYDEPEDR